MLKRIILISIFYFLHSHDAHAFDKVITEKYFMGDNDSLLTSKQIVLNKIKQKAIDDVGVYIEKDSTLKNNKDYSESIKMISASIVKLRVLQERQGYQNKRFYLEIEAMCSVDESELKSRIRAIQTDKSKQEQINKLQEQNKAIYAQMSKLKSALSSKNISLAQTAELLKQQSKLEHNLKDNLKGVELVFRGGTIQSFLETQTSLEESNKALFLDKYRDFYSSLNDSIKVSIFSVKKDYSNNYIVTLKVSNQIQQQKTFLENNIGIDFNRYVDKYTFNYVTSDKQVKILENLNVVFDNLPVLNIEFSNSKKKIKIIQVSSYKRTDINFNEFKSMMTNLYSDYSDIKMNFIIYPEDHSYKFDKNYFYISFKVSKEQAEKSNNVRAYYSLQ
jgi:hypothetical protein